MCREKKDKRINFYAGKKKCPRKRKKLHGEKEMCREKNKKKKKNNHGPYLQKKNNAHGAQPLKKKKGTYIELTRNFLRRPRSRAHREEEGSVAGY
jgi:hypothetical protein